MYAERVLGFEGDGNASVVVVSERNVGGTRGSGIVYSAVDVLGMSLVRGKRGIGGVCEMCMYLARAAWE